jgi:hypothetical protein
MGLLEGLTSDAQIASPSTQERREGEELVGKSL